MKWDATEPSLSRAISVGARTRGHALLWHAQQPDKIYAWDVVNEAFSDDGSGRR